MAINREDVFTGLPVIIHVIRQVILGTGEGGILLFDQPDLRTALRRGLAIQRCD